MSDANPTVSPASSEPEETGSDERGEPVHRPGTDAVPAAGDQPATDDHPATDDQPGTDAQPELSNRVGLDEQPGTEDQAGNGSEPDQSMTEKRLETDHDSGTNQPAIIEEKPANNEHESPVGAKRRKLWTALKSVEAMPRWWVISVGVAGLAVAIVFGWKHFNDGGSSDTAPTRVVANQPAATSVARPAPVNDPPVLVETVTPMRSQGPPGTMALAPPLHMSPEQLATFNNSTYPNTAAFDTWYRAHAGASVNFGLTNITIVGNRQEDVGIASITVEKTCAPAMTGTYFEGYSAGSSPTTRIGFNLDSPNPRADEMAYTPERGLFPDGNDFFAVNQTKLRPGEKLTLTIGAYTKRYSCSFALSLLVSTTKGTFTEKVDDNGKPFRVTAIASSSNAEQPLAGYSMVYALPPVANEMPRWKVVNPHTWKG